MFGPPQRAFGHIFSGPWTGFPDSNPLLDQWQGASVVRPNNRAGEFDPGGAGKILFHVRDCPFEDRVGARNAKKFSRAAAGTIGVK